MAQIQALSRHKRPADYHGWHNLQTDASITLCRRESMRPGKSMGWIRPSQDRRVMLVQRRSIELQAMAEMLDLLGFRVTPVGESGKALLYFGREPCEMVISELDMPQFSGFQLARCIRQHSPQTCILLMTACCQAEVVDYMDGRVVDGWLFKPFRMDVLKDLLKKVTGA